MRVYKVKVLFTQQLFESSISAQHAAGIFAGERQRHMADAVRLEHLGVFAARRGDRNGVSVFLQCQGELIDVRFRTAEAHLHSGHQDIECFLHAAPPMDLCILKLFYQIAAVKSSGVHKIAPKAGKILKKLLISLL